MISGEKLIKVNIGAGPDGKSDWVNLDWGLLALLSKIPWARDFLVKLGFLSGDYRRKWPENLRLHDCRKRLPFPDGSVDYVYTSHFLEHLYRYEAVNLLRECRRILRRHGVLRICVPDVRILAEKYLKGDQEFFLRLEGINCNKCEPLPLSDWFVANFYGYNSGTLPTLLQRLQRRFIRGHFWMYDYGSLSSLLREAGFSRIERCASKVGRVPDLDYLDIHEEGSLFVEGSVV